MPEGSLSSASAGLKTETAILLGSETGDFRAFGRAAWEKFVNFKEDQEFKLQEGLDVRETVPTSAAMLFRWFKVALCKKRGYQSIYEPTAVAEDGQKRPLIEVVSAALRHFKEDILAYLSCSSGVAVGVSEVIWILTIPAIYDDYAKNFMRHAAHNAGIISTVDSSQLRLCLEPEAACLAMNIKEAPRLCSPGSTIMIVDCGGGTVDITTHEIISSKPLRLKEVLPPTGGPWGSTCVDNAFKGWLRAFLGTSKFDQVVHSAELLSLMLQWEDAKTNFGGKSDDRVRLNLGEVARITGIDVSCMKVTYRGLFALLLLHLIPPGFIARLYRHNLIVIRSTKRTTRARIASVHLKLKITQVRSLKQRNFLWCTISSNRSIFPLGIIVDEDKRVRKSAGEVESSPNKLARRM